MLLKGSDQSLGFVGIVHKVNLLTERSAVFLDDHRISELFLGLSEKVHIRASECGIRFGWKEGKRSPDTAGLECDRRLTLVIAGFDAFGWIEESEPHLLEAPGQKNILVPEDRKIGEFQRTELALDAAEDIGWSLHFEAYADLFSRIQKKLVDLAEFIPFYEWIYY